MLTPSLAFYATPRILVRPLPPELQSFDVWWSGEPDAISQNDAPNEFVARHWLWLQNPRRSFESIKARPSVIFVEQELS